MGIWLFSRSSDYRRYNAGMPRFSIKDLLIAIALIAISFSCFALWGSIVRHEHAEWVVVGLWLGAFTALAGAIFAPFKKKAIGALIGLFIALNLWILIGSMISNLSDLD
jgi:hypothetical protein